MIVKRRKQTVPPDGVEAKLKTMLFGDHGEAIKAKQSLVLKSTRIEASDPEQAAAIRRLYKRIKI